MPVNDSPREIPPDHVAVGRVLSTHGLRGEMKAEPLTSQPEHFAPGSKLWLAGVEREVESSRWSKGLVLLKLSDVDDIDAAEALRGETLSLPEAELAPLAEDEYYAYQLVGLDVFDDQGANLGKIIRLLQTGSNDVYVVEGPRGEVLLPAIDDVIVEVDLAGGRMVVSPMDGMLPARRDDSSLP